MAYPLAQGFEKRIQFFTRWKSIATALAISGAIYLAWDELFTAVGVWGFNDRYLLGVYFGRLPLEEVLFFFSIPVACLFIHEVLKHFFSQTLFLKWPEAFSLFFFILSSVLAVFFYPKIYSSSVFILCALLTGSDLFLFRFKWAGRFYFTFFVSLLPFLIFNNWLTGFFTEEPIVWYNDLENAGMRIGTIPIEDIFYLFSMLFIIVGIYERVERDADQSRS